MIVSSAFAGKTYAVLGLARSGLATVETLVASGARVVAWDSREEARSQVAGKAELGDPMEIDLAGFDGIVVSPGVPLNRHPIAMRAKLAGVPIIGDIELFALARPTLPPHKVVGITGTNGKSTTTALIHHIIEQAGYPTVMGGNIGLPILSQPPLEPNLKGAGVYVLELSSYQIDLTHSLDCDVAVLLNITPDHLDRYDGFEGYVASKMRLFLMQSFSNIAVIGEDDREADEVVYKLHHDHGRWENVQQFNRLTITPEQQERWPSLQGPHNAQNAAAAIMVGQALGIDEATIANALASYASLPHRMQAVGTRNGVLYVNDSKATNAASTAPALAAWPARDGKPRIHWILGGVAKSDNLDECAPHFGNVAHAYTIGEAGHMFADLLRPHMAVDDSEMLSAAVRRAARIAQPGDVVLLSPACASFDQFRDFEARGDAFAAAVAALE
ncbi:MULTISPECIES: UDP-N-acetylmuramoyl-L-alanine--D-glutamate ligase [Sphingobium]|mgnify:CR=1 FL=1|jgi:UDP-N-acetylmuramoylalanine--D-glutamate ligase|uniref:UDP-N-acetylmuramoyl-L-alanine--D-glutamate ligase n=1 Tax=Sphingobium TaxID=165695 RepID=UPI000C4AE79A|nr:MULTISPECIES: UDP-N-acetylmuramoyl-L-alanine--D-glutamate ligase [Sphingobium]MAX15105.1 UDP-N-acetylmuramoyl-L-alanine--D-glutamate ligase [Sphingobium sp.]MEC9016405.1 UDP-N-acetylmuramoyl-L-alanine--D-glutamate ligase [Pseudomonadota bacterium]MBA37415.1 UDP-N-acetylmuramoyl-L-alanine--D-glutamate ligase [Sphingobium sp.]MBS48053.1 UDP-N-acetylmuramoyl-L-alanine--D-glutamate ligase [Sphingobium sp.]MCC4255472.1 UDP-N-acetylmuramoyl-L-alanine--D-glutamate ligase [Sphingobium lactosutens]